MRMSESTKNEESSSSSTWHTEDSRNDGLPGMVTCEICGKLGNDVDYVVNPYDQEIYNEENWQWLCDDCYCSCRDDI